MKTSPLDILIVEDEALIAMELEELLVDMGHRVIGIAVNASQAMHFAETRHIDLALVDIHLQDGPTGLDVAVALSSRQHTHVVFMSSNVARIPTDFGGAVGAISKPYTEDGVKRALTYLGQGLWDPPPTGRAPASLSLSPYYLSAWLG